MRNAHVFEFRLLIGVTAARLGFANVILIFTFASNNRVNIPPLIVFLLGAAGPLLPEHIVRAFLDARLIASDEEREMRIDKEAQRLATIRSSYSDRALPEGVSADVADILNAMRKDLVGQLPVVDSIDEGGGHN